MWRIKQLHTVNLTYQARFFVRGERPTELLNINFSSKFDKDLGIYYYFCNKWSVKTTLKQCHASVLNNISSIHQPLKQHTHTYTTLTPWNFHLKSSSNDWNPRSATFFLYHTYLNYLAVARNPAHPAKNTSQWAHCDYLKSQMATGTAMIWESFTEMIFFVFSVTSTVQK